MRQVTTATHEEWVITSISGLGGVGPGDIGLLDVCNARDLFGSSDATSYLDTLCDLCEYIFRDELLLVVLIIKS